MSVNIEIKAKCNHISKIKDKLENLPVQFLGKDEQEDIFFKTPAGRLKLRSSSLSGHFLIAYLREYKTGPKISRYSLIAVKNIETVKELLANILGVKVIVSKIREIYLYENVRIHLDWVKNLGTFIEFEAVANKNTTYDTEYQKINFLMQFLGIDKLDLIEGAYADILERNNAQDE
ncbi:MAG: class IV adenylate cyclase [Calditrichaceae bacterium]|nr:class IV adenylate cyclase [Calditrichaceae bacterium]MBN2707719.1 class IV adenylate cyclase [Calditrichaceae bacterium]RQV96465.1 MAG: class IV adenylate cyclase [Calditrichota bacterium]